MMVYLNGELVPEREAKVSVFDRSFLYGDGLFETIRVFNGHPFRWERHLERLTRGATGLGIRLPGSPAQLRRAAGELIHRNALPDSVLRLTLSRGVGPRGYSPKGADSPTLVMSLHPAPGGTSGRPRPWRLITSSLRVAAGDPLAGWKSCSKLLQVLARAEAERAGADEALLLNGRGEVCEATSGNLFWLEDGTFHTPPLTAGTLPGVTRELICELEERRGRPVTESRCPASRLAKAEAIFLTMSARGVVVVKSLDGRRLARPWAVQPVLRGYREAVVRETRHMTDQDAP